MQVGRPGGPLRGALEKSGSDLPGLPLDLLRALRRRRLTLATQQLLDARTQQRPVPAFDRKAAAEAEQGLAGGPFLLCARFARVGRRSRSRR